MQFDKAPSQSVNTNVEAGQQGQQQQYNFDTSEADAVLAGADVDSAAQTVPQ